MTELVPVPVTTDVAHRANGTARAWIELMAPAVELAKHVSSTEFVPRGLRGKPDAIVAAILYGDALGLDPMQSLASIVMVDGQPRLYAETQRALILAAGHKLWIEESTNTRCTLAGQRRGDDRTQQVTWDMDDAKRAGLSGKSAYRAYPRQMLLARATSDLARLMFADVVGGLAAVEEYLEDGVEPHPPRELDAAGAGAAESAPKTTRRRRRSPTSPASAADASQSSTVPEAEQSGATDTASAARLIEQERELDKELDEAKLHDELAASTEGPKPEEPAETGTVVDFPTNEQLVERALADAGAVEMISDAQRPKLHALFAEKGVTERESKLAYATRVAGRPIESSNDLTLDEASRVIDALEAWDPASGDDPFVGVKPHDPHDIPY